MFPFVLDSTIPAIYYVEDRFRPYSYPAIFTKIIVLIRTRGHLERNCQDLRTYNWANGLSCQNLRIIIVFDTFFFPPLPVPNQFLSIHFPPSMQSRCTGIPLVFNIWCTSSNFQTFLRIKYFMTSTWGFHPPRAQYYCNTLVCESPGLIYKRKWHVVYL